LEFVVRLPESTAAGVDSAGSPFSPLEQVSNMLLPQAGGSIPAAVESFSMSCRAKQRFQFDESAYYGRFTIVYDASRA
jgi:hypothetical protein